MEDAPNVLIINDIDEKPWEIIEDYFEMILNFKDDHDSLMIILEEFFDDVNYWSVQQMLIDQAKVAMKNLELLNEYEHEFIDDDDDDDDFSHEL